MVGVTTAEHISGADALHPDCVYGGTEGAPCLSDAEAAAREFAALDAMIREAHPRPGDTRTCPDCGRPQHYTGTEAGWCHDALVDTWHCADPRKAGA